ncbi:hypothetical protein BN1221_00723 [Brenneria goodwinii]|uniref:Uncharacterized protein n=1 Tax=Brenneria goodwinii TaxID=1109412 RepID=A0A0G4JRH8_9GAMM|nr:hypothetical protein BN1221_00723 [Brenneria goodwinii]
MPILSKLTNKKINKKYLIINDKIGCQPMYAKSLHYFL